MSDDMARVSVRILEKEYQVACPAGERNELLKSAEVLNRKMREIRDSGKVVGTDRIAVMAALNITHELLQAQDADDKIGTDLTERLRAIRERIVAATAETSRQLEL